CRNNYDGEYGSGGESSSASNGSSGGGGGPILEWEAVDHWMPRAKCLSEEGDNPSMEISTEISAEKQALFSVNGSIPEGAFCAIMALEDRGNSTLLSLLSGRRSKGRFAGKVLFEGAPVIDHQAGLPNSTLASFVRQSCYMRKDHAGFVQGLSVFDNLMFAAMLRAPGCLEDQAARVETVIEETGLESHRDVKASGLAVGLQRHLSVALELLSDRRILLLDQPLSGMTPHEALDFVKNVLRPLVGKKVN
ncbi:unnamed protein product, partial [Pylaiella littoralis]